MQRRLPILKVVRLGLVFSLLCVSVQGAERPSAELAEYDALITEEDRQHWSYQPVRRPTIPRVDATGWTRNPIDNFILAKLDAKNWKPAPAARRRALLRRVFLDVIGLPPTPAEQRKFLSDSSPIAWEKVVDDLLARPGYGERWGRHWLDLVRYAETNGYERDATKPHVWRYRDWVIESFNNDKPYNRMILEQLAGDELPDTSSETMIATGFYRLGPWDDEPADPKQDRFDQLDDLVRTTSEVFLGTTLGCCRCHNHKFDPMTMHDYYRLVAIFSTLQRPRNGRTELDRMAGSRGQIAAVKARDEQIAPRLRQIESLRNRFRVEFLKSGQSQLPAEVLEAFGTDSEKQTRKQKELIEKHSKLLEMEATKAMPAETRQQIVVLERGIQQLRDKTPDLPRGYFLQELSPDAPKSNLMLRGRATSPGPEVQPGVPAVLVSRQPDLLPATAHTSRRRLTLARWIANANNPLTARVIVNRVWQNHFGQGLVRTASDFGRMGQPPTHPELLDWLADWFVHDAGWSLKKLHRLILNSSPYRMQNVASAGYAEQDPENELFWRFPYRRLSVEAIRDSMLAVSGRLNRQMYGPGIYLYIPKQALEGHSDPGKIWKPFDERAASRRTVYAFVKRSLVVPMLEVLDLCDTTRSSEQRRVTSVAPQALTLFNGNFVNRQSRHLADRLVREAGTDSRQQIRLAYELVLCRSPSRDELATMQQFLKRESQQRVRESTTTGQGISVTDAIHRALVQMCRVMLNLNEFVYPD